MGLQLDPYALLSRAVASIDRDSYAVRFAIYEQEHKLFLQRLALASPMLSEADITREEQAFRDAIRRIEFGNEPEPVTSMQPPEPSIEKQILPGPNKLVPEFGDYHADAEDRASRLFELSQRRKWPKRVVWTLVIMAALSFAAWGAAQTVALQNWMEAKSVGPQGPAGPQGPPGPSGPPGPAGSTTTGIRFAEFGCASAACTLSCRNEERILNAYALNPGGTLVFEDDRQVTVKPTRQPSGKIISVCAAQ
jgi:hypothetical protein